MADYVTLAILASFSSGAVVGWNAQSNHLIHLEKMIKSGTYSLHGHHILGELTPLGGAVLGGIVGTVVGGTVIGGVLMLLGY